MGVGEELEMAVIDRALREFEGMPAGVYLALNVSPEHIISGAVARAFTGRSLEGLVLEVTEHAPIPDYESFNAALAELRSSGLRLAVDDAGAGYASFRHILSINPDIIKLDITLIRGIHADASRRALAAALITFGNETGARVVAEGVETSAELEELQRLGVTSVQGYLLSRPIPIADALALL
ncbi:MAG: EAL domain-containing protein [Gammaproteobacteria bacterium]|nr:EAL domain-containing protein [Gammaproteobacteria bacterium]